MTASVLFSCPGIWGERRRETWALRVNRRLHFFLDDDDVFLPKKIEESVRVLERLDMDYGGVYCGFHRWNSLEENAERYLEGNLTPEV